LRLENFLSVWLCEVTVKLQAHQTRGPDRTRVWGKNAQKNGNKQTTKKNPACQRDLAQTTTRHFVLVVCTEIRGTKPTAPTTRSFVDHPSARSEGQGTMATSPQPTTLSAVMDWCKVLPNPPSQPTHTHTHTHTHTAHTRTPVHTKHADTHNLCTASHFTRLLINTTHLPHRRRRTRSTLKSLLFRR
jgi:hypothetical protein